VTTTTKLVERRGLSEKSVRKKKKWTISKICTNVEIGQDHTVRKEQFKFQLEALSELYVLTVNMVYNLKYVSLGVMIIEITYNFTRFYIANNIISHST
jgi:hypothetical protein